MLIETGNGDKFSRASSRRSTASTTTARSRRTCARLGRRARRDRLRRDDPPALRPQRAAPPGAPQPAARRAGVPRARHVIQRASGRTRPTRTSATAPATCAENIVPLARGGLLQLVDGETEIAPGVRVVPDAGPHRRPPVGADRRRPRPQGAVPRRRGADGGPRQAAVHHGLRPRRRRHARDQARAARPRHRRATGWSSAATTRICPGRLPRLDAKGNITVAERAPIAWLRRRRDQRPQIVEAVDEKVGRVRRQPVDAEHALGDAAGAHAGGTPASTSRSVSPIISPRRRRGRGASRRRAAGRAPACAASAPRCRGWRSK